MAHIDILLRARRKASVVAFNEALPSNFKLLATDNEPLPGVYANDEGLNPLVLATATDGTDTLATTYHVNIRITENYSGWSGLHLDATDSDPQLDKNKIRRWLRNNGASQAHGGNGPFAGYWRWTGGSEWVDITKTKPEHRRNIWFGDPDNPDV